MAQPNTCMLNRKVKNGLKTTIPYGVDTQADCGVTKESVWNRLVIVCAKAVCAKAGSHRKDYERIKLKTG